MAWLQLIRWKNLLIVLFTQLFAWYCLIGNTARLGAGKLFLDPGNFIHVLVSTLLITAAGYIINDYFDIRIDSINRPGKVVLADKISPRRALLAHIILNVLALAFCSVVAIHAHRFWLPLVQLGCIVLLWFYSTRFKRRFLIGNLVVSFLTALTIMVLVLYEPSMYRFVSQPACLHWLHGEPFINPFWGSMIYCFFAFMLTLMREIVKDMEDHIGDAAEGCVTMPVKLGLRATTQITQALCAVTILALLLSMYCLYLVKYDLLFLYTGALVVIPLAVWMFWLPRGNTTVHYGRASRWLKIIMVSGICSLIIYHYHLDLIAWAWRE